MKDNNFFKDSSFFLNPFYLSYAIILFVASIMVTGYGIYVENQALQIPLVHFIDNSSLYPEDPFAKTLPYYASTVWYLVALFNRFIPLEPLLFSLFLFSRLLVILSAGFLAHTFAPKSRLAIVGSMSLLALGLNGPSLGGENALVSNYFQQTTLSIPFFLLAFAAFYSRKPWLVALWTAIGFNCNSMYGAYALTYLGATFILDRSYYQEWKKWLLAFGLFLLLASPGLMLTVSAFGRGAADNELWYVVSRVRFPYHLFPYTWNQLEFGKFGVLIFLLLTLLYQNKAKLGSLFKPCAIWSAVSIFWLGYAFVAAYVTKSPAMLVMHPARALTLWYGIAGTALVSVCAVNLEAAKAMGRRAFWFAVFIASLLIWNPIIGPYILAVGMMALAVQPVWYYLLSKGNTNRLALLLTLWVVLVGITNLQQRWAKSQSVEAAIFSRPPAVIEAIAKWAKDNTSTDSVFLVNFGLGWQQFRALSERPVFTNWKDGSAILWDRPFVTPWVERLKAIGLDMTEAGLNYRKAQSKLSDIYKKLQDEDVKQLKSRFPLNYWVVPQEYISNFPIVFQYQSYKVLNLKN